MYDIRTSNITIIKRKEENTMIEIKAHNSDIKMLTVKELSSDLRIGKEKAYAEKRLELVPGLKAIDQLLYGLRLIARRLKLRM